jgi:hypothetical protein
MCSSTSWSMFRSLPTSLTDLPAPMPERRLLYWFQHYTANKLPGLFPSSFWTSLLPQASYSEPAILYAVLALTSAHKYRQPEVTFLSQLSTEEQFTLKSYNKAIRYLTPHFLVKNTASLRIALITCVLFVCLEIVQEHYATAMSHLSNGLRLFDQYKRSLGVTGTEASYDQNLDSLIGQSLLKLALQVNMLGKSHPLTFPFLNELVGDRAPSTFICMGEARQHLDKLLTQAFELDHLCRSQESCPRIRSNLVAHQMSLQESLKCWLEVFNRSGLEYQATSPSSRTRCMLLRMYHTLAWIITATSLSPNEERTFDQYQLNFLSILSYGIQSKNMMMGEASPFLVLPKVCTGMQASIIDIGWIPALYYTAIKCRISRIRLHAIRLLESTVHTEGFWNASVAAEVAREVIRIEEGAESNCMSDNFAINSIPLQEELFLPTMSDSRRVHDVEIVLGDGSPTGVILVCRRRDGGVWKHIRREYNPLFGIWADILPETV